MSRERKCTAKEKRTIGKQEHKGGKTIGYPRPPGEEQEGEQGLLGMKESLEGA